MRKRVISRLALLGVPMAMFCFLGSAGEGVAANAEADLSMGMKEPGTEMYTSAEKPEADLTVGLYSQYIWRGYELSQDSLVVQPSMTVAYKGFGFNIWGNLDTDQVGQETSNWNETDITVSYDNSVGQVSYSVGYIYYALEDGAEDTQEIYAGISLDTLLAPTLTVYRDIDAFPGYYITLGVSHSVAINDMMGLDLGAQAGYYDLDDGGYDAFHDGLISAALPIAINEYLTVSPEIYYSFPLSDEASDELEAASVDGDDDSFLYGGVAASFAF